MYIGLDFTGNINSALLKIVSNTSYVNNLAKCACLMLISSSYKHVKEFILYGK